MDDKFFEQRQRMVEDQLIPRGITDPATVSSMSEIPRHAFMPPGDEDYAYYDGAQPIGAGQTISQPYIVALMAQTADLGPEETVLEIGTGSGYGAAVLSRIAKEVYTVERIPELAHSAERLFEELGYPNIHVKVANGTMGWPEHAPYDAIVVTAAAPSIPESLANQLKVGGRLVIPVGDRFSQVLIRAIKEDDQNNFSKDAVEYVRFVPLIGEEGW